MKSLTQFGTYGFLTLMMAAQLGNSALGKEKLADKADRAAVDTKKSAREMKKDLKKAGRKVTGQENSWDNVKDSVGTAAENTKDEVKLQARKAKRHIHKGE